MLQLSDICKMGEDSQMATELVERTLFVMEASFHTMFSLTSGTSRLDYRRQENRYFSLKIITMLKNCTTQKNLLNFSVVMQFIVFAVRVSKENEKKNI